MNYISQKYFSKCIELGVVLRQPKPIRIGIDNIFQYTALVYTVRTNIHRFKALSQDITVLG